MSVHLADINLTLEQREALELRAAGATFEEIGEHQGVNKSTAKRRVDAALDATLREPADKLRELECHRLDRLFTIAYRHATSGGKGAMFGVDRCLSIMERKARLLGLDAPERRVLNVVTEDAVDVAIRELEAELAARNPDGDGDRSAAGEGPPAARTTSDAR